MKSGGFFMLMMAVFAFSLFSCEDAEVVGYGFFPRDEYYEKGDVNKKIRDLEEEIASLQARLDSLSGGSAIDLASLEARVTQNESDISANAVGIGNNSTDIAAHNTRIALNETKLADVSVGLDNDGYSSIFFDGVNVYIQSGTGATDGDTNGLGNLIIGYNENSSDFRFGSHNLIVGPYHSYTSYGGFIAGYDNTVSGIYSSVSGGTLNTASGTWSGISGGKDNIASSFYTHVSGGTSNSAASPYSSISAGMNNNAIGQYSSVSGGADNTASGEYSSVSGGRYNGAVGLYSSVSGGGGDFVTNGNTASGKLSTVSGGAANRSDLEGTSISGGYGHLSSAVLWPCNVTYNWMAGFSAFSCP